MVTLNRLMKEHVMEDETSTTAKKPAQRLCNEIQLFELCDLESCSCKAGRFCTNSDLLERFENIAEVERPVEQHLTDENGDSEEDDELGYDDAFGEDDFDDENYED